MAPPRDDDHVIMHPNHVSGLDCPGTRYDVDDSFDLEHFQKTCTVSVSSISPLEMEFDLVGVDASIANALRRIMYAEVPTMAMETVYYTMNDSVMSDEVLANRIGLVPLKVDPRHFTAKNASTDLNTLVFEMSSKGSSPAMRGSLAVRLMSSQIKWIPQGTQQARFAEPFPGHDNAGPGLKKIRDAFADYWQEQTRAAAAVGKKKKKDAAPLLVHPVHNDIVVAKINRSDTIQAQIHAVRGIGREHAKWTPVELANYRLLPRITITAPIEGEAAVRFQRCFEPGVIEVVEEKRGKDVVKVARVAETRNCGMTRECQRHKEFVDKVELARVRNHFIFKVQSIGQYDSPAEIMIEACRILTKKCTVLREALQQMQSSTAVGN